MNCHTQTANFSLGIEHAQLNREMQYSSTGIVANQLQTADKIGLLTSALPNDPLSLPKLADLTVTGPQPPMIDAPGNQFSVINEFLSLTVTAFDVNGDALSFSATGFPAGLGIAPDGIISGMPTVLGSSTVTVTVNDGVSGTDSTTFDWSIVSAITCQDCIDFSAVTTSSYHDQDIDSNVTVLNAGAAIQLAGNTWRKTDTTFEINAETLLEFTFESTAEGEIHGIGFDEDNALSEDRVFRIFGTQQWGIPILGYTGPGPESFIIPVGQYFTASAMHLVLANDNDTGSGSNGTFSNVRLTNSTVTETRPNAPRSYLHSNCAGCHRPIGPTPSSMDLRYGTQFSLTGTCGVVPTSGDLGVPNARLISPGIAAESIIPNRMNRRDVHGMPPLGSSITDANGFALLNQWINSLTACP